MGVKYGVAIEGKEIKDIHLKHCKYTLNVQQSCPNEGSQSELGHIQLKYYRHIKIISYWLKIIMMDDTRLPKNCFTEQKFCSEKKNLKFFSKIFFS